MGAVAAPRRLSPKARREQLVEAALSIAANAGYAGLSFAAVAQRAGVTRNLVYHYFPGGRADLFQAAVHLAGRQLTGEWQTDSEIPLSERLASNLDRILDHAEKPTDAWLLHRQSRASVDPEVLEIAADYHEAALATISMNHLGTPNPPPLVRIALEGFISYGETALDAWRESEVPREELVRVLGATLVATIDAAVPAEGSLGGGRDAMRAGARVW
jgi:AcrR family transcriptional regulator